MFSINQLNSSNMLYERFRKINPELDCFDEFSEEHKHSRIETCLLVLTVNLFCITATIIITMCSQNEFLWRLWS